MSNKLVKIIQTVKFINFSLVFALLCKQMDSNLKKNHASVIKWKNSMIAHRVYGLKMKLI